MRFCFLRRGVVAVVLAWSVISAAPTPGRAEPPASVLAQATTDQSSSSRISGRGMRGLVKLGIGAVVAVVAGVGWLINKAKEKSSPPSA